MSTFTIDLNLTGEYQNSTLPINSPDLCLRYNRYIEENKHQAIALAVLNILFCLVALVGNSAILIAIWKTPSLHSPANILLANLAISDFGVGLIVQPAWIVSILTGIQDISPIHRALCTVLTQSASFLCGVSLVIVTATGLDRLLALQLHLRYKSIVTNFRVILAAIALWLCIALFSLLLWVLKHISHFSISSTLICIILVSNLIIYFKIYLIVRRHKVQIRHQQLQAINGNNFGTSPRLKSTVVNNFLVFIVMICCFGPQVLVLNITTYSFTVYQITSTLVYLNSTINPFLYFWRVRELRSAVKQLFLSR